MPVRIAVEGTDLVLADKVVWARSARERRRGLLGRDSLALGEGLVLDRARQIHTFRMRFPIDVIFCDRRWKVLHVVREMPPGRVTRFVFRARYCVELPAGTTERVVPGDSLRVH